ncbi:ABC transporter substrate-binding protein [Proteiniclasticum ruminis]|uniref:ABC transporter substrate-binding protein n=1 Tax=Proteiniclasticum ruminis TaxID=398199 RepID=UPI0028A04690|nr:ABC transporter substrate-binding protein [Proteiniclasticum ruminis]
MKKILSLLTILAMALTIVACGTKEDSNSDEQKITIWAWDKAFNIAALEEAKASYLKENPDVEIEIVEYAQDDLMQKLNTGLNSGVTEGLPNITLIEDYRIAGILASYPDAIMNLSDIVKYDDFAQYKVANMTVDGKQYGVPFDSGVTAMFYRTDLIEEAGFTVDEIDKGITWDRFIEIGKAVKEKTGVAMLTLDPSDFGLVRTMMQSAGTWYTNEEGKLDLIGNEKLEKILATYNKLMESGIVNQHTDWAQFVGAVNEGKAATVPTGCWFASSISQEESQSGTWRIAPVPKLADVADSTGYSNSGGSSWYVLNKVGNNELAADFLAKTFAGDVDLINTLVEKINLVTTYLPAATAENNTKENAYFSNQKIFELFGEWTEKIPPVKYGMNTYAIEDLLEIEYQKIDTSGISIEEVLKNTDAQAKSQLGIE